MSWNETPLPFDTGDGVLRLIAALYRDRERCLVSISRHSMQEIDPETSSIL